MIQSSCFTLFYMPEWGTIEHASNQISFAQDWIPRSHDTASILVTQMKSSAGSP